MGSSRARERQRIARACTRCRIKKVKCDGASPCACCKFQDTVCHYGDRKHYQPRRLPPGYVDYLEKQREFLVQLVREVWKSRNTESTLNGREPSLHDIIADCGLEMEIPDDFEPDDNSSKSPVSSKPELSLSSGYQSGRQTPSFDFDDVKFENTDSLLESSSWPLHVPGDFIASQIATPPIRGYSPHLLPSQHAAVEEQIEPLNSTSVTVDSTTAPFSETGFPFDFYPGTDILPSLDFAQTAPLPGVA